MEIDYTAGTIKFKSTPEFFKKEKSGIKNNTVRVGLNMSKSDIRYFKTYIPFIIIENTETQEEFYSRLTDISVFKNITIFTWEAKPLRNRCTGAA